MVLAYAQLLCGCSILIETWFLVKVQAKERTFLKNKKGITQINTQSTVLTCEETQKLKFT